MIGYVHFGGCIGDLVRIDAIRRMFDGRGLAYREFALSHTRPRVNMFAEAASLSGVRHMARKLLVDRTHSALTELNWRVETRQWESTIDREVRRVGEGAAGVTVWQAENLFAGIVCSQLKERTGKPFVYDMHGVAQEEARSTGSQEWQDWCGRWERHVMESADHVVAVSPLMASYVERTYGVARERIVLAPNGTDLRDEIATYAKPAVVVYAGNFAAFENTMEITRAAEIGAGEDLTFWLMGDGPQRQEMFDYVNQRFIDVVYLGRKRRPRSLELCTRAQIGISGHSGCLDLRRDFPRQICCPIKIFDYASCGLPLVIPDGEWAQVVRDADCGIVADHPTGASFVDAIRCLLDRPVWEHKARNARRLAAEYQWCTVLRPLAALYAESGSPA